MLAYAALTSIHTQVILPTFNVQPIFYKANTNTPPDALTTEPVGATLNVGKAVGLKATTVSTNPAHANLPICWRLVEMKTDRVNLITEPASLPTMTVSNAKSADGFSSIFEIRDGPEKSLTATVSAKWDCVLNNMVIATVTVTGDTTAAIKVEANRATLPMCCYCPIFYVHRPNIIFFLGAFQMAIPSFTVSPSFVKSDGSTPITTFAYVGQDVKIRASTASKSNAAVPACWTLQSIQITALEQHDTTAPIVLENGISPTAYQFSPYSNEVDFTVSATVVAYWACGAVSAAPTSMAINLMVRFSFRADPHALTCVLYSKTVFRLVMMMTCLRLHLPTQVKKPLFGVATGFYESDGSTVSNTKFGPSLVGQWLGLKASSAFDGQSRNESPPVCWQLKSLTVEALGLGTYPADIVSSDITASGSTRPFYFTAPGGALGQVNALWSCRVNGVDVTSTASGDTLGSSYNEGDDAPNVSGGNDAVSLI